MIRVMPSADSVIDAAAALFAARADEAVRERGRFGAVLSGGSTPRPLYERLAGRPLRERVPWHATHLFWSDERCVPSDDPASNHGMVARTLLAGAPVPAEQIHPVPCADDPVDAATAYARALRTFGSGGPPRFDLVLLGMGADGHTASLFPGESTLAERERLAVPARGPEDGPWRVTLTLPVLNNARTVLFLVTGSGKAAAVRRVLTGAEDDDDRPPAARVRPADGELIWLVDADAAGDLHGVASEEGAS